MLGRQRTGGCKLSEDLEFCFCSLPCPPSWEQGLAHSGCSINVDMQKISNVMALVIHVSKIHLLLVL